MSDYRHEWMLTYVGGPVLMLIGFATMVCAVFLTARVASTSSFDGLNMIASSVSVLAVTILGMVSAGTVFAYGCYVVVTGRKNLAGDHWRAEHFLP